MKKWEKPAILDIDFKYTHGSEDCTCDAVPDSWITVVGEKPKHHCHRTAHNGSGNNTDDGSSNNGHPDGADHNNSGHFWSQGCPTHTKCCCYSGNHS